MSKLYAIRIETDDCHYTYGYVTDLTRAELEVNCWKRWVKRLDELKQEQIDGQTPFPDLISELRDELWTRIIAACRIESMRDYLSDGDTIDLEAFLANIRIVEVPIGIIWPENPGIRVGEVGVKS